MRRRGKRQCCAHTLRHPPQPPHPHVFAHHRPLADHIHQQRRHLRRGIHRSRMGKRPHQRIAFRSIVTRKRAAGRPGIKRRTRMSRGHQSIPDSLLGAIVIAALRRRLHRFERKRSGPCHRLRRRRFPAAIRPRFRHRRSRSLRASFRRRQLCGIQFLWTRRSRNVVRGCGGHNRRRVRNWQDRVSKQRKRTQQEQRREYHPPPQSPRAQ
jgi:hypothetical protein